MKRHFHWTTTEIKRLRAKFPTLSEADLVVEFAPHTFGSIREMASKLGLRRTRRKQWLQIARAHKPYIILTQGEKP